MESIPCRARSCSSFMMRRSVRKIAIPGSRGSGSAARGNDGALASEILPLLRSAPPPAIRHKAFEVSNRPPEAFRQLHGGPPAEHFAGPGDVRTALLRVILRQRVMHDF